ncbi:MAG TPA: 50S ribosomal protein L23 [Thermoanaerobaculia bacterium]|nr:50S ribosomal protein L23 [Thermoanaerobaculia bacterium]
MRIQDVIRRPLISEKSTGLRDERNVIAFEVHPDATKIDIRRAVESQFKKDNVKVAEVRTANVRGKLRRQGRFAGRRPDWKKAYVRLSEGTIEFFEGV